MSDFYRVRLNDAPDELLVVDYDEDCPSPRKDNDWLAARLYTWHDRLSSPDQNPYATPQDFMQDVLEEAYPEPRDLLAALKAMDAGYVASLSDDEADILTDIYELAADCTKAPLLVYDKLAIKPLYLLDHSGYAISTSPFADAWDSSQIGFAYVSPKRARECFGDDLDRDTLFERAQDAIENEVSDFNAWLSGETYYCTLYDNAGTEIDSLGGFCGFDTTDDMIEDMLSNVAPTKPLAYTELSAIDLADALDALATDADED